MKQSHFDQMRLASCGYTFMTGNYVCFNLKQLSCLPAEKQLNSVAMKTNKFKNE